MSWSFSLLLIVLLFTSLSGVQFSSSEKVKLQTSLNHQQDGHMLSSIFIGNGTRRTINNLSLQLDLDAVTDNSEELIGDQGFVGDTKRSNTVEISTCNDTSKDEEIKGLWSFFCPEKGEEPLNIVSRTEWGGKENVVRQRRTRTADLLIVDGHYYTSNYDNYYERMRNLNAYQTKEFGDLLCNFWISDDGKIFESIGWNRFNYIYNGGLGPTSLIIAFMKADRDAEPSAAAINAFKELVKLAICKKALSLHYSVIPYYLIYDYHSLGNDSFERKDMKTWYSFKENLDFLVPCERVESIDPQIIPKEKWRTTKPKRELMTLSSPIEYIAISQWNARCFCNCSNYLNVIERKFDLRNETLKFNFLLSEEGRVYEVMGWEETWNKGFQKKKVIDVGFLGNFNSYGPSKPMFLALNALIQDGLRSGKLSTHYNIVTIKTADQRYSHLMGDFLENEIRKLDRYTEKY